MSPAALDLFAGAGGLSLGLGAAGWQVAAGVELDYDAAETYERAHAGRGTDTLCGDVRRVDLRPYRSAVSLVAGGPPCQPWSNGGKRLGEEDPRDGWPAFLRALDQVRPAAFLAENVSGLAMGQSRARYTALVREFEDKRYKVTPLLVNAADYGVPQRRQRLLIVGVRGRKAFRFPAASHGEGRTEAWVPAGDVLDLTGRGEPNHSIVTFARQPDLRPNPYDGHLWNGGGRPIDLSRPAPTLLASMGGNKTPWVDTLGVVPEYHQHLLHGGEPRSGLVPGARRISVEEAAALQTFPKTLSFAGGRSSRYRQIGNAVPVLLAEVIGRALLDHVS